MMQASELGNRLYTSQLQVNKRRRMNLKARNSWLSYVESVQVIYMDSLL